MRATTWTSAVCPWLQAQQGQAQPPELTDITRGKKAKPPQSLLPTDKGGKAKGGKGKAKGAGKYGGGASQPTTYREVRRALEQTLPQLRDDARRATERQMAAPGHSHAAQVRVRGGETLSAAFLCVFIRFCVWCGVHVVRCARCAFA